MLQTQVTALLATPANLINSQAESFMMPYGPFGTTDDRHPAYGDYNATQRGGQLFSPWLYEIMKGRNANILSGIPDPRIPYYIYNQKSALGGSFLKTVLNTVMVDLFPFFLVQTEIAAMVLTVQPIRCWVYILQVAAMTIVQQKPLTSITAAKMQEQVHCHINLSLMQTACILRQN